MIGGDCQDCQTQRLVYGSWALSVGDSTRTRLMTSASAHGRVQGEGLCQGQWEAGTRACVKI